MSDLGGFCCFGGGDEIGTSIDNPGFVGVANMVDLRVVLGAVVVVDFFGDNENLTNPVDSLIFLSLVGDNDRSLFGEMGVRIDDLGLVGVLGAKKMQIVVVVVDVVALLTNYYRLIILEK